MSAVASLVRRSYQIHGLRLDVSADSTAVFDAIGLRLAGFRAAPGRRAALSLTFVTETHDGRRSPGGAGRPVYDTPFGTVYYFPQADVLHGVIGGVELDCAPSLGSAVFTSAAFAGRDLYLATHPLTTISLMELLERRGRFSLHAACLAGSDGAGILLAGPSGSGKSTLALAMVCNGMRFVSDDVIFLEPEPRSTGGPLRVLGFADALGLSPHAAACLPELELRLTGPPHAGFPKPLGRIEDLSGMPALESCQPNALVFPRVVPDQPSAIAPLDPREALLRLVPDVLVTHAASTQAHLAAIAALLDQVKCYELRSGRDLGRAARLLRDLRP